MPCGADQLGFPINFKKWNIYSKELIRLKFELIMHGFRQDGFELFKNFLFLIVASLDWA